MVLAYIALYGKLFKGSRTKAFGRVQAVEYIVQRIPVHGIDLRAQINGQGAAVRTWGIVYFLVGECWRYGLVLSTKEQSRPEAGIGFGIPVGLMPAPGQVEAVNLRGSKIAIEF
jgi:hypothetical protein